MAVYNKCHVYFLQSLMNRGTVSELDCMRLCEESCNICDIHFSGDLQYFIRVINDKIQIFHLKIRNGKREDTGEIFYVLASQVESDLNRLVVGGDFTRVELEYFRRIIELIIHSDTPPTVGTVSSIDVLNLADTVTPKISKVDAKRLLMKYIDECWFYDKDGIIYLTPRSIVELEKYLLDVYEGFLSNCKLCSTLVIQGKKCINCDVRMHNYCAQIFFAGNKDKKCVSCCAPWS